MKAFQWGFFTQIFRLNGMSVFESLFGEVGPHYYYQNFPGYGKGKYAADFVGLIESGAIYFGSGSIFVGGWLAAIGTGGAGAAALPVIDSVALAWWAHATMVGGQATAHLFSGEGSSGNEDGFNNAIENGEKLSKHRVVEEGGLPKNGEPNSSADILNPDGSVKQRRYYDDKGRAIEDIDYNHPDDGTHEFPHRHKWDWSNPEKPKRLK